MQSKVVALSTDRRVWLGVSAHVVANIVVALSALLTPALLVPVLGLDSYAFVAFYLHVSVFLMLFDFGLSGLLLRQLAEVYARDQTVTSINAVANLGLSVEALYWGIGLLLGIVLFAAAGPITQHWLKVSPSSVDRAVNIVRFMAIAFVFHWPLFLYQNALIGLRRQVEASILSGAAALTRLATGYWVATLSGDVQTYFGALAICNLAIIGVAFIAYHRTLIKVGILLSQSAARAWSVTRYRGYALQLGLIMMLGYMLVSVDRLLAARVLPLSQYAEYSIMCTLSQGISLGTSAVVGASLPRLIQAFSIEDRRTYQRRFFTGQLAVCVACVPIYVAVAFFPQALLELVAGHRIQSAYLHLALVIHATGTLAHTLMVLSFAAHQCQLRLSQWLGMTATLVLGALVFAALFNSEWGVVGLAYFWLSVCVLQMLIGIAISSRLRYHELSVAAGGRLLVYVVQVLASIGTGYLAVIAIRENGTNFVVMALVASGASFLVASSLMFLAARTLRTS